MTNDIFEERRKTWVKALRSGNYKQGFGKLYDVFKKKFCCLGVATVLTSHRYLPGSDHLTIGVYLDEETMSYYGMKSYAGSFVWKSLSENLRERIEEQLGDSFEGFIENAESDIVGCSLSRLNDNEISFDLIADIIEEKPKGLFTND